MNPDFKKDYIDNEPIMDSVYGIIKISPFEKRLISTKEMQRLRGIKQLGFVNLVYPDAEHSRFAHSIGVCHQSKVIMEHVSKNISNSSRYQRWRAKFNNTETERNSSDIHTITDIERIVISAAALLHDLPHSPFSHEIETHNSDGNGIPVHDDFQNNPVFFSYLFDKEKSDLAKVIDIYNESFFQAAGEDKKWGSKLKDNKGIDKDGYVPISNNEAAILVNKDKGNSNRKLPLLGVMIFEILLFDKMKMWAKLENDNKLVPNGQGVEVSINNKSDKIVWKPIDKWFRPYRKDIVANTICSDLLDYLLRDGRNTGILPSLDLKFFDRMTIAKAIPEKTNTLIPLSNIPDFCEHIVFDIYDHKRGVIRQSVITEIISFLQQRYLLAERVYNHRVVEGARSMLQEASRLLVSTNSINAEELHNTNSIKGSPVSDDAFFSWVLDINHEDQKVIIKAQQLVRMLRERRIFREVVIIDGILGSHKGTFRGGEVDCKTLADALLDDTKRNKMIDSLNDEIVKYCKSKKVEGFPNHENEVLFTVGVRKFGKRYKIPRVLVTRPLNNNQEDDIEIFPLFEGKKLPAISDRLESMEHAYQSLWKVYLFMHPFFHKKDFVELHDKISKLFIELLYKATNIYWVDSIDNYDNLLPETAIDVRSFVKDYLTVELTQEDNNRFILKIIEIIDNSIPVGSEDFQLKKMYVKPMTSKLKKISGGQKIFQDATLQQRILQRMKQFKPELSEAAKDKEELVANQAVNMIEQIIGDAGTLF